MLLEQSILQALVEERKFYVIELYKDRSNRRLQSRIRVLDTAIRSYLEPEIKVEYTSEGETESTSSIQSNTTVDEREYTRQQVAAKFYRVYNNSDFFVKYIRTRKRQYFRKIRSSK